ncbi:MAG: PKD domain-containing protein, partial [Kiritimatiellae bacterium]|nr:PKD domain-containing protein [Kiritimatiellia bacterium]
MNIGKEVRDEYGKCTKGGLFQGGGWLLAVCAASLCASLEGAVSAGSGGTVSTAVEGAQVVATAVPDAGKRFFRWTGDVGLEDPAAETIRVAADADVTALFGNEITVEQDGSGDCPTLNAALDAAADYDTIVLGDGEHTNATPAFAVVANAVKVVSRNGREKTFFKSVKTPNGSGVINVNPAYKGLQVNNDLAIVKGVTFFNFGADGVQSPIGLGIYLQKGLVEFCTVSNCVPNHGCSAIHVVDGEVRHSLIANNRSAGSQGKENAANGAGVRITGAGVVTNCVITGNYANKSVAHGAGAYVAHADARLVDCQIVGNARGAEGYGGGVYLADGTVENCVISNNTGLAAGVYQTGGTLRNCLVAGNASEGRYGGVYATAGTIEGCVIDGNSAKEPGGSSLAMTGGEVSGTVAIEALHAVPSSGIVEVDSSVAVSGCEFQCPCEGVDGADEVNASLYYATGECFVEASRVIGRAPLAVAFTAHAAGDAGAAAWDFGDGATGSGATMAHTFSAPGVYSVGLTAGGESATREIDVLSPVASVSTTGLGIYPYDTWEKAANDLQSAIDAAYADDETAATVYVAAGDYAYAGANRTGESTPWARLAKRVAVIGPEEGTATFDGANNTHGVYLLNAEASMRNLTIYRCYSSLNNNDTAGGALNMTGGVVSNCVFRKCHGNFRGAVTMHGGTILDSRFEENDLNVSGADRRGAGIQIYGAGLVAGCVFEDNKGGYGGGAYIGHADAVISNCVFRGNSAGANGGGAVTVEKGLVTHCVMTNNTTSAAGGGVQISGGTVRNCVVAFNRSTSTGSNYGNGNGKAGGGGLNITGGTVENCTFY